MSRAHTDAVLAMLQSDATLHVHDGKVPDGSPLPYVVLFTDDGLDEATNIEAVPDVLTVRVQITSSGLNRTAAPIIRDKAHATLIGRTPTVSGRNCTPLRQENSRKLEEDRDVNPSVLYGVNEYVFISVPA